MRYVAPNSIQDMVHLLAEEKGISRILAGGTDVLVQLRAGMVEPDLMVDIKSIDGMRDISPENGGFRIGAAVSGAELGEHERVKALWPGVVEAFELIGSTQVQGRATMTGNLCNGSPAADSVPALFAADAIIHIAGPDGERSCPVADIPLSPGKISLSKGEIVTAISLPARPERSSDAYQRFIPRTEMDIAVASAGISLTLDADGICTAAKVSLGAVAPTVLLVEDAANCLIGTKLDDDTLEKMGAACSAVANPIDDKRGTIEFRTQVVAVLAKRVAALAYNRAGGRS